MGTGSGPSLQDPEFLAGWADVCPHFEPVPSKKELGSRLSSAACRYFLRYNKKGLDNGPTIPLEPQP
jgi:hypothetical protein